MSGAVSRRLIIAAAVVFATALAWVAFAGRILVSTGSVGRPDVVIALSGDPLGDRVARAIEVAAATDAPRLVFFRDGGAEPDSPTQIRRRVIEAGIPEAAIRFVGLVDSTAMEAGLTAGLVRRCGWTDIVIVTSPYHTRRATWTFSSAIDDAADVRAVASAEEFAAATWWSSPEDRLSVFDEWVKGIGSLSYAVRPPPVLESTTPC